MDVCSIHTGLGVDTWIFVPEVDLECCSSKLSTLFCETGLCEEDLVSTSFRFAILLFRKPQGSTHLCLLSIGFTLPTF